MGEDWPATRTGNVIGDGGRLGNGDSGQCVEAIPVGWFWVSIDIVRSVLGVTGDEGGLRQNCNR